MTLKNQNEKSDPPLLKVMGIYDTDKHPTAETPPGILSEFAARIWEERFNNPPQESKIPYLNHIQSKDAWVEACNIIYNECILENQPWTDDGITGKVPESRFYQKLHSKRNRIVNLYERTGYQYNKDRKRRNITGGMMYYRNFTKLGNWKFFSAYPIGNNEIAFVISRRIDIPNDMQEYARLVKKYQLVFRGNRKSVIMPSIPDVESGFRISEYMKLEYFLDFTIQSDFVPASLCNPIPYFTEYKNYMVNTYFKTIAQRRIHNYYLGNLDL